MPSNIRESLPHFRRKTNTNYKHLKPYGVWDNRINNMMNAAAAQPRLPEFEELYETLSKEIAKNEELVNRVIYHGNALRPIEKLHPEEIPKCESVGVIGRLWEKVRMLQDQNTQLEVAADHLRHLIGA